MRIIGVEVVRQEPLPRKKMGDDCSSLRCSSFDETPPQEFASFDALSLLPLRREIKKWAGHQIRDHDLELSGC